MHGFFLIQFLLFYMRINIGSYNTLMVARTTPQGLYLNSGVQEVLLPNRFVTDEMKVGEEIEVFVLFDSEDRPVATTQTPLGIVGDIVPMEVVSTTDFGAFLNWGLEGKDLFVPKMLMRKPLRVGDLCVVHIEVDKVTERPIGNPRVDKFLEPCEEEIPNTELVEMLVFSRSPLGFSCIVNGKYNGMIYHNEVFSPIQIGSKLEGYVRLVREDGKLDMSLRKIGFQGILGQEKEILDKLQDAEGFLPYHDNSSPEDIRRVFKMSKKTFKKLVGMLYKRQLIDITHKGIKLV